MIEPVGLPLYRIDFPIRWGDMDALGHVNNIMYFRYFEQTRLQWYESLGYNSLGSDRESMLIVDNHAEYLKPLVYPAHVDVRMAGHSPGRSSFVATYTISVGDKLVTRGSSKVVWIDSTTGRSTPLPDAVRALVETGAIHV